MKIFFVFFLFSVICYSQAELDPPPSYPENNFNPTYENIAGPNEVFVVYRNSDAGFDTLSMHIKNYYVTKRYIPGINTLGLNLPDTVTIDNHLIQLLMEGEMIYDHDWELPNTDHAWRYFKNYIMDPIQDYLDSTYVEGQQLKSRIKYIVLCKGIPLKVNPYVEYSGNNHYLRQMVSLDGLLCFLSQTDPNFSILDDIFGTSCDDIPNPYYNVDKNFDGNYRFKSDYFNYSDNYVSYKINYLVSRLDGLTYDNVIALIDRGAQPDMSGNNLFLLDAHQSSGLGVFALRRDATQAANYLNAFNYNYILDLTDYIYYNCPTPVIGYSSSGRHAGMPYYYNYLFTFDRPNGSIYNTYESYNAFYMDTLNLWNRQDNQGMITEWMGTEGSGGAGHVYEPTTSTISRDSIFFPLYSIGYSIVDAAYQGMPFLAYRNTVLGDPLMTISWGKQTSTQNIEMNGANLVMDTIHISVGDTITFGSNSTINLKRHGFVTSSESSVLTLGSNVTLISDSWDRGLLLAHSKYNPQLIWPVNPSMSPIDHYKIFRKFDSEGWIEVDSVTENTWIDSSLTFQKGNGVYHDSVFYYVKSYNSISISDPSNTVAAKIGITVATELVNGWQLVSVPVVKGDYSADAVFPTHIGSIYAYDNGYVESETLENGPGYWAKFGSAQTVYHSGLAIDTLSIPVPSGWSFLGSISYDVLVGNICTEPSGIISSIYRFDPVYGYVLLGDGALIRPGIGYWLNVNQSGDVIFSGTCGMQKGTTLSEINLADLDKFIITDSLGRQQSLYVANIDIDSTLAGFDRSMPPAMPELGLDARFNYGEFIKTVSADSGLVNLQIDVESIAYPVTLTWEINPENGIEYSFINDSTLGKISKLQNNGRVTTLSKNTKGRLRLFGKVSDDFVLNQIPKEFTLNQNYPNPFNPTTTIKYALPKNGFVTLEVYDILGARVAQLINENQKAGNYQVEFNARRLSSGVYLYKITAGSFSDTKKMLLIK